MKTISILRIRDWDPISGVANGYVGVSKDHPLYGQKDLDGLLEVHGGVTWTENYLPYENPPLPWERPVTSDYWWIGFDTGHSSDSKSVEDIAYCYKELMHLKSQIDLLWQESK